MKKPIIGIKDDGFIYLVEVPTSTVEEPKNMEEQFLESFNQVRKDQNTVREDGIVGHLVEKYKWDEDKARKFVYKRLRNANMIPYFLQKLGGKWEKI